MAGRGRKSHGHFIDLGLEKGREEGEGSSGK
jgi:hypothetical protein